VVEHNSPLLSSITLCCLWLRHNFDFAVPDIEKSPWMEMQIDQNDLDFSNRFFCEFAKILNLLQDRFETEKEAKGMTDWLLLPEQTEFYGIKPLHFVNFDDCKYAQNSDIPFIYHRRFCSKKEAALSMEDKKAENDVVPGQQTYDRLRSEVLMEFAVFSSHKMKGVLVFDSRGRCDSQRMKAVTVDDSQHLVDPQCSLIGSQSANNAMAHSHSHCYSQSYSPPSRSPLDHPHLPHVPGSKHHEFLCSPTFPNSGFVGHRQHLSLSPLPLLHNQQRVAQPSMLKLDARAQSARQPPFSRPRNAYSQSAPSSPNGGGTPTGHSHFMFNQQPPMMGYPENEAIDFGIPDHLNTRMHSLPTTPNAVSPGPYLQPHSHSVHPRRRINFRRHRVNDSNGLTARQCLSFRDSHSDHLPVIPPRTAPATVDPNFHQNAYGFAACNGAYNGPVGGAPAFQSQPPSPVHPIRASSPHSSGWGYGAANYGNGTQYDHDDLYGNVCSRKMEDPAMFTPMVQQQNELDDMQLAHDIASGNIILDRFDGDCSPMMIEEAVTEALQGDGVVLFDNY